MKIGKSIYDGDGTLLLGRGMILTDIFIQKLNERGISRIYIHDDTTEDIVPEENISDIVRGATIRHLRELFESLEDLRQEMRDQSSAAVVDAIKSEQFQNTFRNHPTFQTIQNDAVKIVDELLSGEVTLGLNSIKSYDNYTFQHSIDVTIVSIMIGRKIGLPQKRLRELGIGCLLHDMGKVFVPLDIINKPGKLTPEEFEKMTIHTTIGYELVKGVASIGILPPHIAFQHHEKQDGSGYPRGLRGNNRITFSDESGIIHLYGSISAVADVYDALSSDRPYRKALASEKVIETMYGMCGNHLNLHILRNFFSITPVYPVGSTVRIINGEYLNHMGVVVSLNKSNLDRPVIRLIFGPKKKKIHPIDIDLATNRKIWIESIML